MYHFGIDGLKAEKERERKKASTNTHTHIHIICMYVYTHTQGLLLCPAFPMWLFHQDLTESCHCHAQLYTLGIMKHVKIYF